MKIEAVVFDCDGVILESTDIKTEAFRALFRKDHPRRIPEILDYHVRHMGISRHVKFRHICTEILGERYTPRREAQLAADFSRLVFDRVLKCPVVPGAREFLRRGRGRYRFFVASGTPHEELERILRRRRLLAYFERAWGSPAKKPDVIRRVLRDGPFRKGEVVFVGDAESDWRAAKETGVRFVRRVGSPAEWKLPPCPWEVKDLRGLPAVLREMERD
ncbi:MAG: HAD family hydrolase [Elusimicrobia bacterium]|nr:HAD family hydrolase [Elusimicrobiota bacterium]